MGLMPYLRGVRGLGLREARESRLRPTPRCDLLNFVNGVEAIDFLCNLRWTFILDMLKMLNN